MKVVSVVGARPQFVKLAPVDAALRHAGHQHVVVHTGQHYDRAMSEVFFDDLAIPAPDVQLAVGSAGHGAQTGAMLAALEPALLDVDPDWVLVYGDTNSTLAGAVAAVKVHLPVAHLEAGLRSFNRRMPEEHNRVLTDHAADLLLAPTTAAMTQLGVEGLAGRSVLVGDVMTDISLRVRDLVGEEQPPAGLPRGGYLLATVHRAENTDDPDRLRAVLAALAALPLPVLLPAHPRLRAACAARGVPLGGGALVVVEPMPYRRMAAAVLTARSVLTDSGGLQKEAFVLGRTCTTLRTETEWTETLVGGWNLLAPDLAGLAGLALRPVPEGPRGNPFGDGRAAEHVVSALTARSPRG